MKNKKIVIAGGTGFIGRALAAWLGKENEVIILSRQPQPGAGGTSIRYRVWDGLRIEKEWASVIDGCDMVINLAGKSVNCRYTAKNRKEILDSRIDSTRAIGLAVRDAVRPPKVWINAASATIYRHATDRPQDEYTGEIQDDFSVRVCKAWEKAFQEQRAPFTRKIALRTAITLGEGGVMVPYLNLVRAGLGGRQGTGRQQYSWVHIDDLCRAVEWIYDHPEMEGVYNMTAPGPVTNRVFMQTLRKVTGICIGVPVVTWMLKVGAVLIETETELVLKSRWVLPARLLESGFTFRYPTLEEALKAIIVRKR